MKVIFIILLSYVFAFSQEYERGKIDMHGGKFDNYGNTKSYGDSAFGQNMGLSGLLDINATKDVKKKVQKKN